MFITRKSIPRRTFLQGAGVTLALPFLEAMLPAQTPLRQSAANQKTRFLGVAHPMGAAPGFWSPTAEGRDFEFSFITKPLEPYRDKVILISGLDATTAMSTPEEPGGDHARLATVFTGARPRRNAVNPYIGVSIDQHIAQKIGQDTLVSSIQVGCEDAGPNLGVCNWGYHCAYTNSMSWVTPTQPLPTQINPRVVFERMFGDGTTAKARVDSRRIDGSILDSLTRKIAPLRKDIGGSDRAALDKYLEDVRDIERRMQTVANTGGDTPNGEVPFGVPESYDDRIKIMYDLIFLAFQSDATRVATILLGRDSTQMQLPESGYDGPWHPTSHHDDNPTNKANYAKMNRYHVRNLAAFVEKLKNTPDGDGAMLDHILIQKSSNMGNSHRHAHEKCPNILIGGAGGRLKGNNHIVYPDNTKRQSDMLLSVLDLWDIHLDTIGDSIERVSLV